jgi:hypothetical protein
VRFCRTICPSSAFASVGCRRDSWWDTWATNPALRWRRPSKTWQAPVEARAGRDRASAARCTVRSRWQRRNSAVRVRSRPLVVEITTYDLFRARFACPIAKDVEVPLSNPHIFDGRRQMAVDRFADTGYPAPASRSFVLASLRGVHLWPRLVTRLGNAHQRARGRRAPQARSTPDQLPAV